MHVDDVVDAVEVVWKRGTPGEIYNIASDDEMTVMEVTQIAIETLKSTKDYDEWIEYVEDRPFNDRRYHICSKKLKALVGLRRRRERILLIFSGYSKCRTSPQLRRRVLCTTRQRISPLVKLISKCL